MEIEKKSLKKDALAKLFERISAAGKTVYAPVKEGDKTDFQITNDFSKVNLDYIQTIQSAKSVVFPRVETLFEYKKDGKELIVKDVDLTKIPQTVVFGAHPCDAASFKSLSAIFKWDITDEIYNTRLNNMVVIGLSCNKHDDACFCTSVKLAPNSNLGSDILLTPTKSGDFLVEVLTEKGKELADQMKDVFGAEATAELDVTEVPVRFDLEKLNKDLTGSFEGPFWKGQALRCLGCGACAFICPTCACFDIQDEGNQTEGKRVRCWDSCGFPQFTLHTSGHNPREVQTERWRQRILHKFSYMPERLEVLGCIGCGRCSRACPVDMNIVENLIKITEDNK